MGNAIQNIRHAMSMQAATQILIHLEENGVIEDATEVYEELPEELHDIIFGLLNGYDRIKSITQKG